MSQTLSSSYLRQDAYVEWMPAASYCSRDDAPCCILATENSRVSDSPSLNARPHAITRWIRASFAAFSVLTSACHAWHPEVLSPATAFGSTERLRVDQTD